MIDTNKHVTTNMKCIRLDTLDQFIVKNKHFMQAVLEKYYLHSDGELNYCSFYLSLSGELHMDQFPFPEVGERFGEIELSNMKFNNNEPVETIAIHVLCFIYSEYQKLVNEQSCSNNNELIIALNNNKQMFTPTAYADFITDRLDKIDDSNCFSTTYLIAAKEYGLNKILISLNDLKNVNSILYRILLSYTIKYYDNDDTNNSIVYYLLVRKLQQIILKQNNITDFFNNGFGLGSYYYNILIRISQSINKNDAIVLPLNALTFYENTDDYDKVSYDKVFYTMQSQADFNLFIKNIRVTDVGFLSVNYFLKHSNAKVKLRGNKSFLIKQLENTLRQRGAQLGAIKQLINFIS